MYIYIYVHTQLVPERKSNVRKFCRALNQIPNIEFGLQNRTSNSVHYSFQHYVLLEYFSFSEPDLGLVGLSKKMALKNNFCVFSM